MWLNPKTGEVRTMQGWKNEFHDTTIPTETPPFAVRFERWFYANRIKPVKVYIEHR
jgi:hypothetical protein